MPYAQIGLVGSSSAIGTRFGIPYTVPPEETKITFWTLVFLIASSICKVGMTFERRSNWISWFDVAGKVVLIK
jgi:hypothetical protein